MSLFRRSGAEILSLVQRTTDPAAEPGKALVYAKNSGGATKVFMRDGAGAITEVETLGGPGNPIFIPVAWRDSHTLSTPRKVVSAFEFTRSSFTATTFKFRAVAAIGNTIGGRVELYNVTDSASVTILNFSSIATTLQVSGDLTGSLSAASKIYEVRIYLASPLILNDSVELYSAALEINQ